jgi:hypothetical protein
MLRRTGGCRSGSPKHMRVGGSFRRQHPGGAPAQAVKARNPRALAASRQPMLSSRQTKVNRRRARWRGCRERGDRSRGRDHLPPRIGITTPSLSLCCTKISVRPNGAVTFHPGSSDTQVPSRGVPGCPSFAILTASNRMNCPHPFRSNQSVPAPYFPTA